MINAFEEFINSFGEPVEIIHKKVKYKGSEKQKDKRGRLIYEKEIIDTIARVKQMRGTENLVKNGILKVGDAVGLFSLDDFMYLNANSKLKLIQNDTKGNKYELEYEMDTPIMKKTHAEVNMRRIDI